MTLTKSVAVAITVADGCYCHATATAPAAASATATAAASGHRFFIKRGRLVVSCGSGWKTAGYFMMKLPHLFMKTQRDSN